MSDIEGFKGYWDVFEASETLGDPYPQLTAAQWALESSWGKRMSGNNNPFGQKGRVGEDDVTFRMTWEIIDGERVEREEPFMNYPSLYDAMLDRYNRWIVLYSRAESVEEAIDILLENWYATDTDYKEKILAVIETAKKNTGP